MAEDRGKSKWLYSRAGDNERPNEDVRPPAQWVSVDMGEDDNPSVKDKQTILQCKTWKDNFREFCGNTSLHGMQYLGEKHLSMAERICWLVAIIICLVLCSMVIKKQWNKWESSPVIVTFSDTTTPVWEIPFPAVTICSEVKFKQSVFNYTDLHLRFINGNTTEKENIYMDYSSLICNNDVFEGNSKTMDNQFMDFFYEISPKVDEILVDCVWGTKTFNCSDIFFPVLTDDGICYTFNSIAAEEMFSDEVVISNPSPPSKFSKGWDVDTGYKETDYRPDVYPRRSLAAGYMSGLTVNVSPLDEEVDGKCRIPLKGFKMVLHNPAIFPDVIENFFRIPSRRDVLIGVHPQMIQTSKELKSYPPKDRKCFFHDERKLYFYKIYTQENCQLECFTNYTRNVCGCVDLSSPRDRNMSVCGKQSENCYETAVDTFYLDIDIHKACNCLPSCSEIKYDVEVSQAGIMWEKVHEDLENTRYGSFSIVLRDMQVLTRKRNELFGATDFLANCGGLLGLFHGFSILSLVEIIYYLSLRLYCKLRDIRR